MKSKWIMIVVLIIISEVKSMENSYYPSLNPEYMQSKTNIFTNTLQSKPNASDLITNETMTTTGFSATNSVLTLNLENNNTNSELMTLYTSDGTSHIVFKDAFQVFIKTQNFASQDLQPHQSQAAGGKWKRTKRLPSLIVGGVALTQQQEKPKKKQAHTYPQPKREEYASSEVFNQKWDQWRKLRDRNNQSVKESRERKKQTKQ